MTQAQLLAMPDSDMAPVTEGAVIEPAGKNSNGRKGAIVERIFEIAALERGYEISVNIGGGKDFDYIIRLPGGRPVVIQIKTGTWDTASGYYKIKNNTGGKLYLATAYDVLAVFLPDRNQWLFYLRSELGNRLQTTYTPRDLRLKARKSFCGAHGESVGDREPDNWELLESLTANQKSSAT